MKLKIKFNQCLKRLINSIFGVFSSFVVSCKAICFLRLDMIFSHLSYRKNQNGMFQK
jgi:hypothetical protein